LDGDSEKNQKGKYPHYMLKEIFEQPESLKNSMVGRLIKKEGLAKLGGLENIENKLREIERLIIVGCGSAYLAGLVGEYMFEEYAGIPTEVELASEFRYRKPIFNKNTALLCISQSGETADTLAALQEAKRKGVLTLGIVNSVGSSIARETDVGVYNHIGPEIGVASTKAFTAQILALLLLALKLAKDKKMMASSELKEIIGQLEDLPAFMADTLTTSGLIKKLAKKFLEATNCLYLGRGYNFPIALEGALKLKELSYVHAEGMPAGESKHGPLALIDAKMPVVIIATRGESYGKTINNLAEIKARGGKVIVIVNPGDNEARKLADELIIVPSVHEILSPFLNVILLQLFAYHSAFLRGRDVDRPRNLVKSVTVE